MADHVADDEVATGGGTAPGGLPGSAWRDALNSANAPGSSANGHASPVNGHAANAHAPNGHAVNGTGLPERFDGPTVAGLGSAAPVEVPMAVPVAVPAKAATGPTVSGTGRSAVPAQPPSGETTGPADPEAVGRPGRWVALSVLVLAVLIVALDSTVLGLAVPFLSEDLAPSGTQLLWIGDVYAFILAGLLVSMGGLGDRIGRKKLLLIGAVAFGGISALAAYSPTPGWMIAARAAMGVAGAAMMPSTLALIRNLFPDPRERTLAVGIWGATTSAGAAVGPVVGGFLLEHFWWGSVFLINLPVMVVLVVVGAKLLPESRNPSPGPWDLPSVLLSLLGMVGLIYGIKESAAYGLGPKSLLAFAVGVCSILWFVRRQRRLHAPLLDLDLFRRLPFSGAVIANLMTVLGLAGLVFFLSQFLQLVQGRTPLLAGLAQLPAAIGAVGAGLLAGLAARRLPVRLLVSGGLVAIGLALAGVVMIGPEAPYPFLAVVLLVCGLGAGMAYTVSSDVILSCAPKEQAGAASAVSETAYELGAALGIALLGSVVTGMYRRFSMPDGVPKDTAHTARQSLGGAVEAASRLPGRVGEQLMTSANHAFVSGLRVACAGSAVLLLLAAGLAWFLLRGYKR